MIPRKKKLEKKSEPIIIEVTSIPPTVNHAYGVTGKGWWYVKKQGKAFKKETAFATKHMKGMINPDLYKLTIICEKPWIFKNGKIKRDDISNRIKIAEDALAEGLGIDDKCFLEVRACKLHSDFVERTLFIIEEVGIEDAPHYNFDKRNLDSYFKGN